MALRFLAAVALAAALAVSAAFAQQPHWPDYNTLETQMFFGMHSEDGSGVSEQEWAGFLKNEITPRFPNGLTVISVYGQGSGSPPADGVIAENTKLLIVVHENTKEAQTLFGEIEDAYKSQFGQKGVFRVDFPARIAN